jgi:mannose/fructose/N-acetylgalactosamine-specific phosphotransferase system component IIC
MIYIYFLNASCKQNVFVKTIKKNIDKKNIVYIEKINFSSIIMFVVFHANVYFYNYLINKKWITKARLLMT